MIWLRLHNRTREGLKLNFSPFFMLLTSLSTKNKQTKSQLSSKHADQDIILYSTLTEE